MDKGVLFARSCGFTIARVALATVAVLAVFPSLNSFSQSKATDEIIDNLVFIADPSWGERDTYKRRFRFLLREFNRSCHDIKSEGEVGGKLAFIFGKLRDFGLEKEEGLLLLSNNLYRLTTEIKSLSGKDSIGCVAPWATYLMLRKGGHSTKDSMGAIKALHLLPHKVPQKTKKKSARAPSAATKPRPRPTIQKTSSPGDRFLPVANSTRKLIKQGHENVLEVSIGSLPAEGWLLIIEVSRGTPTQYARIIGNDSLYVMTRKFSVFGPADYEVEVMRPDVPWDTKKATSLIWKGVLKKGERRAKWEQILGEQRPVRIKKPQRNAVQEGQAFDAVYDSIFSAPKGQ